MLDLLCEGSGAGTRPFFGDLPCFVLSISRCLCTVEQDRFSLRRAHASSWLENVPRRRLKVCSSSGRGRLLGQSCCWATWTKEQMNDPMKGGFYMLHGNVCSIYPSTLCGITCVYCKWRDWYSIFSNTTVWKNDSEWDFDWNMSTSIDYSPTKSSAECLCMQLQTCMLSLLKGVTFSIHQYAAVSGFHRSSFGFYP